MLSIIFGDYEEDDFIFDPDTFFDNTYEDEWITDTLSVKMIKDVDKSDVIGSHLIESPVLGPISTEKLSGGVKTLILVNNDTNHVFNASACGDNCAKWLLEIGKRKDVMVRLGYFMDFSGLDPIEVQVVNTGRIVHSSEELDKEIIRNGLL